MAQKLNKKQKGDIHNMDNVLEEIQVNTEIMDEINGAGKLSDSLGIISWYFGNHGFVCTWTVECMSNCK